MYISTPLQAVYWLWIQDTNLSGADVKWITDSLLNSAINGHPATEPNDPRCFCLWNCHRSSQTRRESDELCLLFCHLAEIEGDSLLIEPSFWKCAALTYGTKLLKLYRGDTIWSSSESPYENHPVILHLTHCHCLDDSWCPDTERSENKWGSIHELAQTQNMTIILIPLLAVVKREH